MGARKVGDRRTIRWVEPHERCANNLGTALAAAGDGTISSRELVDATVQPSGRGVYEMPNATTGGQADPGVHGGSP